MPDLIPLEDLPDAFRYPAEFVRTVELGLTDLEPWQVLTGAVASRTYRGLAERYPDQGYVPFAARQDNDDLACWVTGPAVVTVHDHAAPGWERRGPVYDDFHAWLRAAIEDYIHWGELERAHGA